MQHRLNSGEGLRLKERHRNEHMSQVRESKKAGAIIRLVDDTELFNEHRPDESMTKMSCEEKTGHLSVTPHIRIRIRILLFIPMEDSVCYSAPFMLLPSLMRCKAEAVEHH